MLVRALLTLALAATALSPVPDDGAPTAGPAAPPPASPLVSRWAVTPRGSVSYAWPTGERAAVLREFSAPSVPWGAGHRGVDLELPAGAPVYSAAAGVVAFAGTVVDRPVVSIDHLDGIRTTHEPVSPVVTAGDVVEQGDLIGTLVGGHCEAACLHFGARTGRDSYIDPLLLLVDPVVRLYPW